MRGLGSIVVMGMLILGGCGESAPEPGGADTEAPSAAASEPVEPGSSPDEQATPEESESPTVEPATGEEVTMGALSLRVPAAYAVERQSDESFSARGKGLEGSLSTVRAQRIDSYGTDAPWKKALKDYRATTQYSVEPKEQEPVLVDGVEMFHAAGFSNEVAWTEAYGAETEANVYLIEFDFIEKFIPPTKRRKIIESVLATVQINE